MTLLKMTLWPFIDIPRSLHFVSRILLKVLSEVSAGGLFGCLRVKLLFSGVLIFLSRLQLVSGYCVPIRRSLKLLSNVPGAELEIGHCSKIVIIKIYHMTKAFIVL